MIRILIADDHARVRDGFRRILEETSDLVVAGEAADAPGALQLAHSVPADVLLLDISMPGGSGMQVAHQLKTEGSSLKIVIVTMHAEPQYAKQAFKAGAAGFLTKDCANNGLTTAVRTVANGGLFGIPEARRANVM